MFYSLRCKLKKGKIPIKNGTRILEGAMCTEDFPAECKNENAGCALTLPNTIKTVFLQQCQHMHGGVNGKISRTEVILLYSARWWESSARW